MNLWVVRIALAVFLIMEKTTFRDRDVKERLSSYVKVRFKAEDSDEPEVREVLDYFGVVGLPTYVLLAPVGI